VISPVTLTAGTTTLTLYPVGSTANTNPNRSTHTTTYNTPLYLTFSAGDAPGIDGINGTPDDWGSQSGFYTEDPFCRPSIVVKPSITRFVNLQLAPQASTTGQTAYANGMRYAYNTDIAGNYTTQNMNAATQGTYTIDAAGNTPVAAINLLATYTIPGEYNLNVTFGTGKDTIRYSAKGVLPDLPLGQASGTVTISLEPFKKDAAGNYINGKGQPTANPAEYVFDVDAGNNGNIPNTIRKGRNSDIINYYTTLDDPSTGVMTGTLEVPIWFGYRPMKIVSLGSTDFSLNNPSSVGYSLLNSAENFGYNGTVAVGGITLTRITTAPTSAAAMNTAIRDADVVLIQYGNAFGNNNFKTVFKEFIERGGALMYSCETSTYATGVINAIYGVNNLNTIYEGGRYKFGILQTPGSPDYINNPILNGVFSQGVNITAIGNDNGTGTYITTPNALTTAAPNAIVMATRSDGAVFMFFDPSKALLYCADGGWLASNNWNNASTTTYPLVTTSNYKPRSKGFSNNGGYPTPNASNIYNSYIFCNYLAWAIEHAANNRNHSLD
jgi:hypothetical protein